MRNPPEKLANRIRGEKPTRDQAKMFLDDELGEIIPEVDDFLKEMKLGCLFKDVTYEMLNDEEFHLLINKHFRYPRNAFISYISPYDLRI